MNVHSFDWVFVVEKMLAAPGVDTTWDKPDDPTNRVPPTKPFALMVAFNMLPMISNLIIVPTMPDHLSNIGSTEGVLSKLNKFQHLQKQWISVQQHSLLLNFQILIVSICQTVRWHCSSRVSVLYGRVAYRVPRPYVFRFWPSPVL